jgi:hypothetical protein
MYLSVLYNTYRLQHWFPFTALMDWSLQWRHRIVHCENQGVNHNNHNHKYNTNDYDNSNKKRIQAIQSCSIIMGVSLSNFLCQPTCLLSVWRYYSLMWKSLVSLSLSPQHGVSSGCGWRNGLQIWRVAASILNTQSRTADKGWSSSFGVGQCANNSSP